MKTMLITWSKNWTADSVSGIDDIKNGALCGTILLLTVFSFESNADSEPSTHQIEISKGQFLPNSLEIRIGDSVQWVNRDYIPHTATAKDKNNTVLWDTGNLGKDESNTITMSTAGSFEYYCLYHTVMKAEITVID